MTSPTASPAAVRACGCGVGGHAGLNREWVPGAGLHTGQLSPRPGCVCRRWPGRRGMQAVRVERGIERRRVDLGFPRTRRSTGTIHAMADPGSRVPEAATPGPAATDGASQTAASAASNRRFCITLRTLTSDRPHPVGRPLSPRFSKQPWCPDPRRQRRWPFAGPLPAHYFASGAHLGIRNSGPIARSAWRTEPQPGRPTTMLRDPTIPRAEYYCVSVAPWIAVKLASFHRA